MEYKVLYRKYRPDCFEDLVGQDYIVKTLVNAIKSNKIAHAYLFSGPRGTGKTSMAKIFAKTVNCSNLEGANACNSCSNCLDFNFNPDIIEIDAASNNGVDEIREIINNVRLAPAVSKKKVYIIDEVHMLSQSAFNALLLTLEEPPSHVIFILATTDVQSVPVTVLSRCQRFDFRKIQHQDLVKRLMYVTSEENIVISDEAIDEIALMSDGGLRDALSILDQLLDEDNLEINLDRIIQCFGTVSNATIYKLIDCVENNDISGVISLLSDFSEKGVNSRLLIEKLIIALKDRAIKAKTNVSTNRLLYKQLQDMIFSLNQCLIDNKNGVSPYILVELILLDFIDDQFLNVSSTTSDLIEEKILAQSNEDLVVDEKNVEESVVSKSDLGVMNKLIEIRINNCFFSATKSDLKKMSANWKKFINELREKDKNLLSLLDDSEIVLASSDHAILKVSSSGVATLINDKLSTISELFYEIVDFDYLFITLCDESWSAEKQNYMKNKKNNVEYKLIDEKIDCLIEKDETSIELIAKDLFGEVLEVK